VGADRRGRRQACGRGKDIAAATAFIAAAPDNRGRRRRDHDGGGAAASRPRSGRLKQMAAELADHADRIAAAARARDARTAGDLIGETDAVCESCHMTYWYPE
jgi:cytochrome c556